MGEKKPGGSTMNDKNRRFSQTFRQTLSIAGCLFILSVFFTPANAGMYGDIDGDGGITVFDALLTLQYALNIIPHDVANDAKYLAAGDVYPLDVKLLRKGDGNVDVLDALLILQGSVNLVNFNNGTYLGAWALTNGEVGTVKFMLGADNTISGVITNPAVGTAQLAGTSDYNGNFSATYTYPGDIPGSLDGTAIRSGNFLKFSLVNKIGPSSFTIGGLAVQASETPPNLSGIWAGTVTSSLTGAGLLTNTITMTDDLGSGTYFNSKTGGSGSFVFVAAGNEMWQIISPLGAGTCSLQGHSTLQQAGASLLFEYSTLPWCPFSEHGSGVLTRQLQ